MKLPLGEAAFARSSEVTLLCGWITKATNVPPGPQLQVHPSIIQPSSTPQEAQSLGPGWGHSLPTPIRISGHVSASCTLSSAQDLGPLELFPS